MKTISEKVFVKTSEPNQSSSNDFIFWSSCVFFGFFLLLGIILVLYFNALQGSIINISENSEIKKGLTVDTSTSGNGSILGKKILNVSDDQESDAQPSLVSKAGKFEI